MKYNMQLLLETVPNDWSPLSWVELNFPATASSVCTVIYYKPFFFKSTFILLKKVYHESYHKSQTMRNGMV